MFMIPGFGNKEIIKGATRKFNDRSIYLAKYYGYYTVEDFYNKYYSKLMTVDKTKTISPAFNKALEDHCKEENIPNILFCEDGIGYDLIYNEEGINIRVELKGSMGKQGWTGNNHSDKVSKLLLLKFNFTEIGITHMLAATVDLEECKYTKWVSKSNKRDDTSFSTLVIHPKDSCHVNFICGSLDTRPRLRVNTFEFLDRVVDDDSLPIQILSEEINM